MKKKLFITILLTALLVPNIALADGRISVGGEDLYVDEGIKTNHNDTAKYIRSENTLELNNYSGTAIIVEINEPLKIVLKGENTIMSIGMNGIDLSKDTIITGDGTLKIFGPRTGIKADPGNIEITCKKIEIIEPEDSAISAIEGGRGFGNITINSDITVVYESEKHADQGIYSEGNLIINGGNLNIVAGTIGILANNFTINDGKIVVNSDFFGVIADSSFKMNDGYLEVKAAEKGTGIAIAVLSEETPIFILDKNLEINPSELSIQSAVMNLGDGPKNAITIGTDGIKTNMEEEIKFTNIANEVIIKSKEKITEKEVEIVEENPNTYDNIYNLLLTLFVSLGGLIVLNKKTIMSK